ncbi:MAG TPA: hypothetical protein VJH75_04225 [Patescibacteria group bacterium]|nr:hypothetical protein [Patescibacteria group bacterium]
MPHLKPNDASSLRVQKLEKELSSLKRELFGLKKEINKYLDKNKITKLKKKLLNP